jgi:hypothetical protein
MPEQRRPEELRDEIGHAREDFAGTLDELVNQRLNAREQLQRHPVGYTLSVSGVSLALGVVVGTLVGRLLLGRRSRRRQPRFLVRI